MIEAAAHVAPAGGPDGAARVAPALASVVGVLVEVPVMLSACPLCNRTQHGFDEASPAQT